MVATFLRLACFLGALLAAGLGQSAEYGATPSGPQFGDTPVSPKQAQALRSHAKTSEKK